MPLFFFCDKYGNYAPKVNTISREHDKRVQQSFLLETSHIGQSGQWKILNQNPLKNESKLV